MIGKIYVVILITVILKEMSISQRNNIICKDKVSERKLTSLHREEIPNRHERNYLILRIATLSNESQW